MSALMLETPFRSSHLASDLIMLYGNFPGALRPETPLAYDARPPLSSQQQVLIRLDVILEYQRIIFDLEQKILAYKAALDRLTPPPIPVEEGNVGLSTPINAASVRVIDSILASSVRESAFLRAPEEKD